MDHDRSTGRGASSRAARAGLAALLALLATCLTLATLEGALRLRKGRLLGHPDPYVGLSMAGQSYPGVHDPLLGYVPKPGTRGRDNPWHKLVTIDSRGTRSNGPVAGSSGAPLLAVGDSFTFGDEVDDRATWPAALERVLHRPVINGGVFGYGFDQMVLRAEILLEAFPADTLVVALIPDDVDRCEFSYRWAWKPYFDVVDGALVLRNTPVPDPARGRPGDTALHTALGYSFLADWVLRRLDPIGWPVRGSLRAHRRGGEVAALLVDRLADAAAERGHRLVLLLLWHPGARTKRLEPVVERARSRGVPVVALEALFRQKIDDEGKRAASYFTSVRRPDGSQVTGHLNARGNALVAEALAERLRER